MIHLVLQISANFDFNNIFFLHDLMSKTWSITDQSVRTLLEIFVALNWTYIHLQPWAHWTTFNTCVNGRKHSLACKFIGIVVLLGRLEF